MQTPEVTLIGLKPVYWFIHEDGRSICPPIEILRYPEWERPAPAGLFFCPRPRSLTRWRQQWGPGMFYELTWLGAVLLGLGVLVVRVPALWMIVRAVRHRAIARDHRGSRHRRLGPDNDRP